MYSFNPKFMYSFNGIKGVHELGIKGVHTRKEVLGPLKEYMNFNFKPLKEYMNFKYLNLKPTRQTTSMTATTFLVV